MTDVLGFRKKFGVLAPSTNTIVEPEFNDMRVPGVTCHTSRIFIRDPDISSDAKMESLLGQIREDILVAVSSVMTAQVDAMVMGMSLETFWDGLDGNKKFLKRIKDHSGLPVYSGAGSCQVALDVLKAKRIAVLTPYQEIGDRNVNRFFADIGIEVVALKGLRCLTATSIAEVSSSDLRKSLVELAQSMPDAIVQVGTNLSMVCLADEAERWLGLPVLAINAATWWHALRESGIKDQRAGFGTLLRDH
jgi:maleate isomerase